MLSAEALCIGGLRSLAQCNQLKEKCIISQGLKACEAKVWEKCEKNEKTLQGRLPRAEGLFLAVFSKIRPKNGHISY